MRAQTSDQIAIDHLINHRIVVERDTMREVIDLLCFNADRKEVLIDYCDGTGESRTYWMNSRSVLTWLRQLFRFNHHII